MVSGSSTEDSALSLCESVVDQEMPAYPKNQGTLGSKEGTPPKLQPKLVVQKLFTVSRDLVNTVSEI